MSKTFKQFCELIFFEENRDYEIVRDEKAQKAIIELKGKNSEIYTKLAYKLERIEELEAETKALKKEIKDETKTHIQDLFDAEDVIYTRVISTVSVLFTLSKNPKSTKTPQYKKILEELEQFLSAELLLTLENLKKIYVTTTEKQPSLSWTKKIKTEFLDSEAVELLREISYFKSEIERWAPFFDAHLEEFRSELLG